MICKVQGRVQENIYDIIKNIEWCERRSAPPSKRIQLKIGHVVVAKINPTPRWKMTMNINRDCPRNERTYPCSWYTSYCLHVSPISTLVFRVDPILFVTWILDGFVLRRVVPQCTVPRCLRRDAPYRSASHRHQLLGCVISSRYRLMNEFRSWMRWFEFLSFLRCNII